MIKLQEEKASLHNEDKIKVMKDGQSKKATYYNHIHTLFSLYSLSRKQQDIMCNMCFMPSSGISARIFSKWLELPTLNDVNDLIETGFVQSSLRHTISLHPMIQEIAVSETAPSVTSCHTLLDSLQKICLMHGIEVSYYKKLFQTVENIMLFIEKDDIPQYPVIFRRCFSIYGEVPLSKGYAPLLVQSAIHYNHLVINLLFDTICQMHSGSVLLEIYISNSAPILKFLLKGDILYQHFPVLYTYA